MIYGKNDFVEISKNFARCRLKIILLDHLNNIIRLNVDKTIKSFNIIAISLNILHNYYDTKLFLDLYLTTFLDTSVKSFHSFHVLMLIKNYSLIASQSRRIKISISQSSISFLLPHFIAEAG